MKIHHFYIYLERGNFSFHSCLCLLFLCVYGKCTFRIFLIFPACTCHQDSVKLIKKLFLYLILALHLGKFLEVFICRTEGGEARQSTRPVWVSDRTENGMHGELCLHKLIQARKPHHCGCCVPKNADVLAQDMCLYICTMFHCHLDLQDQVYTSLNIS